MFSSFSVGLDQRAVVFRNGVPIRALAPGRSWFFGFGLTIERYSTKRAWFDAPHEVGAVFDPTWFREVSVAPRARAIVTRRGRPIAFLRPGSHFVWTLDPTTTIDVYSVDEPMPQLTEELLALVPKNEYVVVDVPAHARGLLFLGERFERELGPGRFATWSSPDAPVAIRTIDMRRQQIALAAQELMTRDKVTIRVTIVVEYAVEDVVRAAIDTVDVRDSIYSAVQLAARDYLAGVTLDELLEGRRSMNAYLEDEVVAKARVLGVRVEQTGVKDVVLPGEMKTLLNRVIEAEKEAAANVILRREEASATRLRANSAKIYAEQPILMRLTELEAMKDVAMSVGDLRIVVGADGLERVMALGLGERTKVDSS